jgi:hypothetical protein
MGEQLVAAGGEGMVVKPLEVIVTGKRGLVEPSIKCRGPEYLRIIYGPEYLAPHNLERLRERRLGKKRSLAQREFALGIEALERFVAGEPLHRVHEAPSVSSPWRANRSTRDCDDVSMASLGFETEATGPGADCWCSDMISLELSQGLGDSPRSCSACDPVLWHRALATYGVVRCRVPPLALESGVIRRILSPLGTPECRVDDPRRVVDRRLLTEKAAATRRGDETFHADEAHRQGPDRLTALGCARGGVGTAIRFLATEVAQLTVLADELAGSVGVHEKRYTPGQGRQQHARIRRAAHPIVATHRVSGSRYFYLSPLTIRAVSSPGEAEALDALWSELASESWRHSVHWWEPGDVLIWDNIAVVHRSDTRGQRGDRLMFRTLTAGSSCDSRLCLSWDGLTPVRLADERENRTR